MYGLCASRNHFFFLQVKIQSRSHPSYSYCLSITLWLKRDDSVSNISENTSINHQKRRRKKNNIPFLKKLLHITFTGSAAAVLAQQRHARSQPTVKAEAE
uniref:Uncharacterized protein n=1 Tax=Trypanosoma congolense (strain IL3000) TaxID=1068625 RepID=G0URS5_TRYCI|nr:hypothetical protein, unlikely [Trypanosoma congolense IL3000]